MMTLATWTVLLGLGMVEQSRYVEEDKHEELILVLQAGLGHAPYQAGVVSTLLHFQRRSRECIPDRACYDVRGAVGTSAGAVNATLAALESCSQKPVLHDFWRKIELSKLAPVERQFGDDDTRDRTESGASSSPYSSRDGIGASKKVFNSILEAQTELRLPRDSNCKFWTGGALYSQIPIVRPLGKGGKRIELRRRSFFGRLTADRERRPAWFIPTDPKLRLTIPAVRPPRDQQGLAGPETWSNLVFSAVSLPPFLSSEPIPVCLDDDAGDARSLEIEPAARCGRGETLAWRLFFDGAILDGIPLGQARDLHEIVESDADQLRRFMVIGNGKEGGIGRLPFVCERERSNEEESGLDYYCDVIEAFSRATSDLEAVNLARYQALDGSTITLIDPGSFEEGATDRSDSTSHAIPLFAEGTLGIPPYTGLALRSIDFGAGIYSALEWLANAPRGSEGPGSNERPARLGRALAMLDESPASALERLAALAYLDRAYCPESGQRNQECKELDQLGEKIRVAAKRSYGDEAFLRALIRESGKEPLDSNDGWLSDRSRFEANADAIASRFESKLALEVQKIVAHEIPTRRWDFVQGSVNRMEALEEARDSDYLLAIDALEYTMAVEKVRTTPITVGGASFPDDRFNLGLRALLALAPYTVAADTGNGGLLVDWQLLRGLPLAWLGFDGLGFDAGARYHWMRYRSIREHIFGLHAGTFLQLGAVGDFGARFTMSFEADRPEDWRWDSREYGGELIWRPLWGRLFVALGANRFFSDDDIGQEELARLYVAFGVSDVSALLWWLL